MIMGEREGGWSYDDVSKEVFYQREIALKQKTTNNYLLYIFVITTVSIHFHGFPVDLSTIVLSKPVICLQLRFVINLY